MRKWGALLLGIFLVGCGNQDRDTALLETPKLQRPLVAFVPVMDASKHDLNWDVSEELSSAMRHNLTQKNRLYLVGGESFLPHAKRALATHHPFEPDTTWIKKAFPQNEFVVFTELLEHDEIPSPSELILKMRVGIFDLRDKTPKIVLQEIVEQAHHIPQQFTKTNFNQVPWGDELFDVSPLGIAHDQLCKELSSRIEDYILMTSKP